VWLLSLSVFLFCVCIWLLGCFVWLLSCFKCFFVLCLYMVARVFCVVAKLF